MTRISWILLLVGGISLAGCQPTQPAGPSVLSEADKAAIESSSQAFLKGFRAADWNAVSALYTEDAVLMPPNAPTVQGKEAIGKFFGSMPPAAAFDLQNVEIDGREDLAFVRGTYRMTLSVGGGEPVVDAGKYLEIRRKQADGSWLIWRDTFNSDVPAAGH
ncbi:MAG: DUF4440 domain-containing protein [Acidobacteriota bacterium]